MVELKMFIPRMPHRPHSELAAALVKTFGGCTLTLSLGMWADPAGKVQVEGVDVVWCYIPDTDEARLTVEEFARAYKADAKQLSVLYSIGGNPTFIED